MTEEKLREVLGRTPVLPAVVETRLAESCDMVRRCGKGTAARQRKRPWRRTLLLAAVICVGLAAACGAVYSAFHGDFYRAMFGRPDLSREAETRYGEDGTWSYTLPKSERVEVDEEQAEELVGEHITDLDQSLAAEGYTFTFLSHLYDPVSGVGRIYYTVENPEGLDAIRVWEGDYEVSFPGQRGEAGIGLSFSGSEGTLTAERTYQDPAGSTAERMALCTSYTTEGFREGESVRAELWTRRPEVQSHLSAEVTPVLEAVTLPAEGGMSGVTAGEGTVLLSAIGAAVEMDRLALVPGEEVRSLWLEYADGSRYVVIDDGANINNSAYAARFSTRSGCAVNRAVYAFNRLVDIGQVSGVTVNGAAFPIN